MATTIQREQKKIKNWWIPLLLGILFIFLGIWLLRTPLESYASLSLIFSAFILLSGLFWIALAISNNKSLPGWGWYLVGGVFELIIGVLLIMYPLITLKILPFFIGFWLFLGGIMAIVSSFQLKYSGAMGWRWLLTLGIATLLFSTLLLAKPGIAGIGIVLMTAASLITLGVFRVVFAFKIKKIHKKGNVE